MTIDKAIDLLQTECCVPNSEFQKPKYQAIALGIEALKDLQHFDKIRGSSARLPLPGETKD